MFSIVHVLYKIMMIVRQDHEDIQELLSPHNTDMDRLKYAARQVAHFATDYAIGDLEFCRNHRGEDDIALFEFATRQQAYHSCLIVEKAGKELLMCLVGDSLLEARSILIFMFVLLYIL